MTSICLINSFGPMASSVIASIVEHMGYLNIPLRKLRLNHYINNDLDVNNLYMREKFLEIIKSHSKKTYHGGLSVIDRQSGLKHELVDLSKVKNDLENLYSKNFQNIVDQYTYLRNLYKKAVVYKEVIKKHKGHIELTTDIYKFNQKSLYHSYLNNFDGVFYINIIRSFSSWFSSLSTQWFVDNSIKQKFQWINIEKVYKDYQTYKDAYDQMPGLSISFDEIFYENKYIIKKISKYLNFEFHNVDWESVNYDLYGKLRDFEKTFTKFDDNLSILNNFTKKTLEIIIKKKI